MSTLEYVPGGPFSPLSVERERCGLGTTAEVICEYLEDNCILRVTKIPNLVLPGILGDNQRVMLREIEIYKRLDANPHPFVLHSLGSDPTNFALYLPHCTYGNINRCRQLDKDLFIPERTMKWCFQLASAVRHLHSLNIYHCDLSIGNILVDDDGNLQVCDFGGSSVDYSMPERLARSQMTIHDYHNKTIWTIDDLRQVDIFAMASMFYVFNTRKLPYEDIESKAEYMRLYSRSIFPDTSNMPLGNLIRNIWTGSTSNIDEIVFRIILEIPLPPN